MEKTIQSQSKTTSGNSKTADTVPISQKVQNRPGNRPGFLFGI